MSNNLENMNHKASSLVFLLLVGVGLGFVSFIIFDAESIGVFAQANVSNPLNETHSKSHNNTLYVSGTATDKVDTDIVTISIGVQSTNKSATDALNSNSKIANEIISSLIVNGVKENEINTSQYTIRPNYNYSESDNIMNTIGFTVANIFRGICWGLIL